MVSYQIESEFGCVSIFQVSKMKSAKPKVEYESAEAMTSCCTGLPPTEGRGIHRGTGARRVGRR